MGELRLARCPGCQRWRVIVWLARKGRPPVPAIRRHRACHDQERVLVTPDMAIRSL